MNVVHLSLIYVLAFIWSFECQAQERGDLRITGSTTYNGRLEYYNGAEWGTVCDFLWGSEDAQVACRQLGYVGVFSTYTVDDATGAIHLYRVECEGDEDKLTECSRSDPQGSSRCDHSNDVAIFCADGGVIAGIVIGVLSPCILCCVCIGVCICCAVHTSKKKKTTTGVHYPNSGGPQPTTVYTYPTATGPSVNPPSFNQYVPPAASAPPPTAYTGLYPPNTAGYPPPANITDLSFCCTLRFATEILVHGSSQLDSKGKDCFLF